MRTEPVDAAPGAIGLLGTLGALAVIVVLGALGGLGGCASLPGGDRGGPVPARLAPAMASDAGNACRVEIERFAEQHTGNRVLIGPAAFAGSDELVLVKGPVRGQDGRVLDGRAARPDAVLFKLELAAGQCRIRVPAAGVAPGASSVAGACRCVPDGAK